MTPPAGKEPFLEARISRSSSQLDCKEITAVAISNSFAQVRCCFIVWYQQAVKVTSIWGFLHSALDVMLLI